MKATEAKLLEFLKKSPQFLIPIYQRIYSWTESECRQLWNDILAAGSNDAIPGHFVGSIVYIEKGLYHVSHQSPLLVIDGQQRLTTVILVIEALARALGTSEPMDGFSARKLRNYYLLNPEEEGERRYKLVLSQTDKASLKAIMDGHSKPPEHSLRVEENFGLFQAWIKAETHRLMSLCKGIAKLIIVDISLDREQDNPQLIFESLNSTGLDLSQADLIRNFILMRLEPEIQTKLYEHYWRPMELEFGQEAYASYFDAFMRHYLTVKTGDIPNVNRVYDAFKAYARTDQAGSTEDLVHDVRQYAGHFCSIALGKEPDRDLKDVFHNIRELKVDVALPFLLELYKDYSNGTLRKDELVAAARLVESYVFRRSVCGIPTNSLNRTFATFGQGLRKDRYLESIQANFLLMPSYRRFPSDEEFKRDLQTRDLYSFRSRSYWLRRLENHGRKERVLVEDYTIEHIMPQNENLSAEWRKDLGPEWERVREAYLHTLGNLTLTGYNSEYSDHPFKEKRDMEGGFANSPLRVNQGLGTLSIWNEATIVERGRRLADVAASTWVPPRLDEATLAAYRPTQPASVHSLGDYPHLAGGPMRALFDSLRTEVLALNPCVTQEILKHYIAFKAETNFVDVVPQAKRLRLSLNMVFHEIDDPRGLCKDVSAVGRWGNGDVEVGLSSTDDLPYVVGLVRQSLERQLGNGEVL